MRHLDGLYTQRFNRLHRRDGALFRGRYKAILVDKDNYLAQVVRYIHLNPLGAGLVGEPASYLWSSHRWYLRPRAIPKWLRMEEVMANLKNPAGFHEFVLEGNEKDLENFYKKQRRSPVLGSEEFRERVREESIKIDREHVRYERAAVRPSMDQVLGTLAKAYGLKVGDLLTGRRGRDNEPRKLGMYLVKELCDLKLSEIAQRFGTSSYGTVGWACHAVAARINSDTSFCNRVTRIRRYCQQKT
jgi:hypothetical protein